MCDGTIAHRGKTGSNSLFACPAERSSVLCGPVIDCHTHSSTRQMRHLAHAPRHIKDRRRRVTLRAERAISAAVYMILANVVFAGKGMLKVPGALIDGGTFGAATLSVVHAGSHFSLTFHYGTKRSTNLGRKCTKVTKIFITNWEYVSSRELADHSSHRTDPSGVTCCIQSGILPVS
jgi:hypothetical protein